MKRSYLVAVAAALTLGTAGCSAASTASTSQDPGVSKKAEASLAAISGKVLS